VPINANSVLGDVAISVEILGGVKPYTPSLVDAPNDFGGYLDAVVDTNSDEIINLVLNAAGVAGLPNGADLTGQIKITDALRRSVTFDPFTIPQGSGVGPGSISPTTGSFFDNATLGTVVINLGAINATQPVVWSIVSGFDNGTGALLEMQTNGQMTVNSAGVTYYGANPGNGTLTGFVTFVDSNGLSPPAPVQITFTVFASAAPVASISMLHAIA